MFHVKHISWKVKKVETMKNDTRKTSEIIRERKELLDIIAETLKSLERSQNYLLSDYKITHYKDKTDDDGNIIYDEDGKPEQKPVYESVDITYDELTDYNKIKYDAYNTAIALISKLV